jgi:hypothetical protein
MQTSTPDVYAVAAITPHFEDLLDLRVSAYRSSTVGERQDADQQSRRLCRG